MNYKYSISFIATLLLTIAISQNYEIPPATINHVYKHIWETSAPSISNFSSNTIIRVGASIVNKNRNTGYRITGGQETGLEQFPWTVYLTIFYYNENSIMSIKCGGTLISSKYVLTAAHCLYKHRRKMLNIDVYLAEYDLRTFPDDCKILPDQSKECIKNIVVKADKFKLHPKYEPSSMENDIALIRLQNSTPYTNCIRPICLPTTDIDSPDFDDMQLTVTGWGLDGIDASDIKRYAVVNLVPHKKCIKFYSNLPEKELCASGKSGQDPCAGDSGGPLMMVYEENYVIVGIVSGKRKDWSCATYVPVVYTNVYRYLNWIQNNIKD